MLADGTSRYLIGVLSTLPPAHQEEVMRRCFLWGFYLLRTPLFDKFTKVPLSWILSLLGRIPLIGSIFENMLALAEELQSHWFYVSASS